MEGIRLAPSSDKWPVPEEGRAFAYYFAPIADELRPLYWYADCWESSPFGLVTYEPGGEERLAQVKIALPTDDLVAASLYGPGSLPDLAPFLYDDWIDLIGFRGKGLNPLTVAAEFSQLKETGREKYDLIERYAEICFFCMDGWSWEVYAQDLTLIGRTIEHVKQNGLIRVDHCELHNRDTELWNWGSAPNKATRNYFT
jgi:hypothetical protein